MGSTTLDDLSSHALWLCIAILWCMPVSEWLQSKFQQLRFDHWRPVTQAIVLLTTDLSLLILSTALLVGQSYNPFLYFRF